MAKQLSLVPHVLEIKSSNPRLTKSYTALQMVRYRFNTYASSRVALALCREEGHCKLVTSFDVIRRV